MEQYDRQQSGFFTDEGLHYGQYFFGGELEAHMQKYHGCQHGKIFC